MAYEELALNRVTLPTLLPRSRGIENVCFVSARLNLDYCQLKRRNRCRTTHSPV